MDALKKPLQKDLTIDPGSGNVVIDGKILEIKPLDKNGKLYLPLKSIADFLGMKLSYQKDTGILDLYFEKLASEVKGADPATVAAGGYAALGIKAEDKDKIMQTPEDVIALQGAALKFLKIRFGITFPQPPRLAKSEKNEYRSWSRSNVIDFKTGESRDATLIAIIHEHTHQWMYNNSSWPHRTCFIMEEALPMWVAIKFAQFIGNKEIEPKRKDVFRYNIPEYGDAIELALLIEGKYGEKGTFEFFKNPRNYPEGKDWKPTGYSH